MKLHEMKAPRGSKHRRKRVGRGQSSGWGKTAGRGGKGQKARSGNMHFEGFEGGQMPLQRRLPKFGFKNPSRKEYVPVNVVDLGRFAADTVVDPEALRKAGLVRQELDGVKILGDGILDRALTVRAHRFSQSAKEKIEKAGGKAEVI
ncbi:MAG: 50S ribosomal protein L15 [Myxococcales bacterium]